jgi:predicted enzyme related to lactoylglutathione lyase
MKNPRYVIAVPDLEASAAFYRDVLGFEVREIGDPGWRFYYRKQVTIMAGECPDALPPRELGDHSWFAYIEVDDIDALYASVAQRGAEVISPLADQPWGMREFGIRTVDGHRIRFGRGIHVVEGPLPGA